MNNTLNLPKALNILLNWQTNDPKKMERFITSFYSWTIPQRSKKLTKRFSYIVPDVMSIDNYQDLLEVLLRELRKEGLEKLIIYLLENDRCYENTDTIENYKTYKPYPSYFIKFAYLFISVWPKKSRRLFEAFWEYQAKVRPGIYVDCSRKYLDPFIEQGITTKQEIQQLLIRDWHRWQEQGDPYYGASVGISTWYFDTYDGWDKIQCRLETEWREKYGKEPKKGKV